MSNSAFDTGERSAFDSWYDGMVGFHINSERIHEDLFCFDSSSEEKAEIIRKWMIVCWNNAIEAAQESIEYNWRETREAIENLKEPLDKTL